MIPGHRTGARQLRLPPLRHIPAAERVYPRRPDGHQRPAPPDPLPPPINLNRFHIAHAFVESRLKPATGRARRSARAAACQPRFSILHQDGRSHSSRNLITPGWTKAVQPPIAPPHPVLSLSAFRLPLFLGISPDRNPLAAAENLVYQKAGAYDLQTTGLAVVISAVGGDGADRPGPARSHPGRL